jgi:hypothetical protein
MIEGEESEENGLDTNSMQPSSTLPLNRKASSNDDQRKSSYLLLNDFESDDIEANNSPNKKVSSDEIYFTIDEQNKQKKNAKSSKSTVLAEGEHHITMST